MNTADSIVIAVERAMAELRAGRPVWLDLPGQSPFLFKAAELAEKPGPQVVQEHAAKLLTYAQLLPQVAFAREEGPWLRITPEQIDGFRLAEAASLTQIAEASLPLKAHAEARVKVFRPRLGMTEHLAILIGQPEQKEAPLVRVHSSCLTGDLLGSLRCDCGDQLHLALAQMATEGEGILCYLNHEGRGIGIGNKIRAYQLQDAGRDTVEANQALGFAADERDFTLAAAMLKSLGVKSLRLLTNNPRKIEQLTRHGLQVAQRVPLLAPPHAHNQGYLETKSRRLGHQF